MASPSRQFQSPFGTLPVSVMERMDITVNEKYMLMVLSSFADRDGECWPSVPTLAERAGLSDRYVKKLIARLVEVGLVESNRRGRRSNIYKIVWVSDVNNRSSQTYGEQSDTSDVRWERSDTPYGERSDPTEHTIRTDQGIEQLSLSTSGNGNGAQSFTFAEWFSIYPKRQEPLAAEAEWKKALKKTSSVILMEALKSQLPELSGREHKFIPKPASWLKKGSWMNEDYVPHDPEVDRVATLRKLRASGEYRDDQVRAMCGSDELWQEVCGHE